MPRMSGDDIREMISRVLVVFGGAGVFVYIMPGYNDSGEENVVSPYVAMFGLVSMVVGLTNEYLCTLPTPKCYLPSFCQRKQTTNVNETRLDEESLMRNQVTKSVTPTSKLY